MGWLRHHRIGATALALCASAGAPAPARAAAPVVVERVHAHVADRLAELDPSVRAAVARTIVAEARTAGLDPLVVLAVIQVESAFDPAAISSAGALGLMQLREPTLRAELARQGVVARDPRDPVPNVQAGVRYLARLVSAFGSFDVALMAYNAGPARILGHLRAGGIPERFHVYPRKVRAEVERLRRAYALERPAPAARTPVASHRALDAPDALAAHARRPAARPLRALPCAAHRAPSEGVALALAPAPPRDAAPVRGHGERVLALEDRRTRGGRRVRRVRRATGPPARA